MMKYYCHFILFVSFVEENYLAMTLVTLYWIPLFPRNELVSMFVTAQLWKTFCYFFFDDENFK